MKILITPYNWSHSGVSGGEIYLMRLIKQLPEHEFRIICNHTEYYEWEGIPCYPQGRMERIYADNNEHVEWCDIVLLQLIGSQYGYAKAAQHQKPLIFIAHNNSYQSYPIGNSRTANIIYNSYQLREDLHKQWGHFNSIVFHPLLSGYTQRGNKYVTLVNCNGYKGGAVLVELAKLLPHIQFCGVLGGYGDQITAELPNLTYLPNGTDMAAIYAETRLLIVPSEYESYSQAALEAMQCGIPVIANPTAGLKENLAYAGIFIDRKDIQSYANKILYLLGNETAYKQQSDLCLRRIAGVKDMAANELVKLKEWINKIV